jgi:nucleotide-binding universal stress UspA family protein
MKTLLVSLRLDAAVMIARQHGSHIIGYMPIPGPLLIPTATPLAMVPFDESMRSHFRDQLPRVRGVFEQRMTAEDISFEFRSDERPGINLCPGVVSQGRSCDLIILQMSMFDGKISADSAEDVADIVLACGRPVLAIPPISSRPLSFDRVTVAWNASRESARAAFDAVPLLTDTSEVELVWINPHDSRKSDVDLAGADIAAVLARYDIKVTDTPIESDLKAGPALVEQAVRHGSDLMVIGAYGRSRLRERILGGATDHILRHPPCALLLSN